LNKVYVLRIPAGRLEEEFVESGSSSECQVLA
jgi:hypothetical protein